MLNYSVCQLITMIILKHLSRLNALCEDELIDCRLEELNQEYVKTQEYQELSEKYFKLFHDIQANNDQEQFKEDVFEIDSLMVSKLAETQKFYYLAGIHDTMKVFNVSDAGQGDCP
jgi:hypothetical protein